MASSTPLSTSCRPVRSLHAPDEEATAIARTVEALGVAPIHPMLHDSALVAGAAFASANTGAIRSMMLVNVAASLSVFPAAVFDVPVLGRLVLRVPALSCTIIFDASFLYTHVR